VLGVGDQRRGVDALADPQLVPGDGLVADDAQYRPRDARLDMDVVPVLDELTDALEPGEGGAGPDDHGDADPGQVLGAFQPVGVLLRWWPP